MKHPTRHYKSKNYSLGEKQISKYQISISASENFREQIISEAMKRKVSVSRLMRDSFTYAINNKFGEK